MQVDVLIDKLTDCLVERETGNVVDTEYAERTTAIRRKEFAGWKFDWSTTQKDGYTVYDLFVEDMIQYKAEYHSRLMVALPILIL